MKIVFDLDGTLLPESILVWKESYEILQKSLRKRLAKPEDVIEKYYRKTEWSALNYVETYLREDLERIWYNHFLILLKERFQENPRALEYIQRLKFFLRRLKNSHQLYIVSSNKKAEEVVGRLGLREFFDGVYSTKEKSEMLRKIGADVYVGDSKDDYRCSKDAKVPFLLLLNSHNRNVYEKWKGVKKIESVFELEDFIKKSN